jgi:hypothetical protein
VTAYLLGLATLPAIALAVLLVAWVVLMSQKREIGSSCEICEDAGYRDASYEVGAHNGWYVAFDRARHRIRARLPRHRDAWERYFVRHPSWKDHRYTEQRAKYGRPS